ncbi:hypothetical protein SODG_002176 [Sodalis praecaptivus]
MDRSLGCSRRPPGTPRRNYKGHRVAATAKKVSAGAPAADAYSICTEAVLVVPLGTSAPDTMTIISPLAAKPVSNAMALPMR